MRLADVNELGEIAAAIRGCDAVIHLAGVVDTRSGILHDERIHRSHVLGTASVIEACRRERVPTLIYISSACALADGVWGDTDRATRGTGLACAYGCAKAAAEKLVIDAHDDTTLMSVCVRPQMIFGPGDPIFTSEMLFASAPPPMLGNGQCVYTPSYVKNLAAFLAVLPTRLAEERCRVTAAASPSPTAFSDGAEPIGGTVLDVGDAHVRCADLRNMLLACRVFPPARWAPNALPLAIAWCLVAIATLLDAITLGRLSLRACKLVALSPAALYYMAGADFAYGTSGYARAGFTPPHAWPEGVKADLRAHAATVAASASASAGASVGADGRRPPPPAAATPLAAVTSTPGRMPPPPPLRPPPPTPVVFAPWQLRGLKLRNRVHKEATFEAACTPDGLPTPALLAFHERHAQAGVALTTVAYAAVTPMGRSFGTQLVVSEAAAPALSELTRRVRAHGGGSMIQLTHAGSFADRHVIGAQQIAPSVVFNPAGLDFPRAMDASDIAQLARDFASAASVAVRCGFEAIQIHAGHGYLLSQWLSPCTNTRTDAYGSTTHADRCRVVLQVCAAVRAAIGPAVPIVVKANVDDGIGAAGVQVDRAIHLAQLLEAAGDVDLLVASGGMVQRNGFYMLRGAVPLRQMAAALHAKGGKLVMALALRLLGRFLVPSIPYQPGFFAREARMLRAHTSGRLQICLVGGVDSLACMRSALADGMASVAIARPVLRDPEWLHGLMRQEMHEEGWEDAKDDVRKHGTSHDEADASAEVGQSHRGHGRLCTQCKVTLAPPPGPPWCHVCYGAVAIVGSAMAEKELSVGAWPLESF